MLVGQDGRVQMSVVLHRICGSSSLVALDGLMASENAMNCTESQHKAKEMGRCTARPIVSL